ncbi:pyrroline-5-carboxylate reductase dimerization domain-containing protein [uncultured Methanobrevibacter sp.]|uniref:pyrroline-5-carboxylate reductase dimerization domain-containing protein n=1 Tax=uncultured Methanobrevibacter sp. TaxID=253161 RepID=UPI002607DAA4|nr:pyrroline-5-carboxylate reductase dimerization domain-containing protein [uncultured Methanobrevibacter sp.]
MNIGIIGYGNIGELIAQNIIKNDFYNFNKLYISNRTLSKINHIKNINSTISITDNNIEIAKNCEKIIISVKTPDLISVLEELKPYVTQNTQIIHTCAGINTTFENNGLTCVIPTISSTYDKNNPKKGVSIIIHDENVPLENKKFVEELFSKFSQIKIVNNNLDLEIATIAASCMPAFIALSSKMFAEKLEKNCDLTKEEIFKIILETLNSTSYLLEKNIYSSDELINKVATKNGITQKGLDILNEELPDIYKKLIYKLL